LTPYPRVRTFGLSFIFTGESRLQFFRLPDILTPEDSIAPTIAIASQTSPIFALSPRGLGVSSTGKVILLNARSNRRRRRSASACPIMRNPNPTMQSLSKSPRYCVFEQANHSIVHLLQTATVDGLVAKTIKQRPYKWEVTLVSVFTTTCKHFGNADMEGTKERGTTETRYRKTVAAYMAVSKN
jgi:hypothetical protein